MGSNIDLNKSLRNLLMALPSPVAYLTLDFSVVFWNQPFQERFDMPLRDRHRLNPLDVMDDRSVEFITPYLEAAREGTPQMFEGEINYRNGQRRSVRLQYIPDKPDGTTVAGIIVVHHEILTQHQRDLMDSLKASQEYLRLVLDSSQHGIWGLNMHGQMSFINRRALKLLGYESESELLDRSMHELVHHHFADGREHPLDQCPMYDSFKNRQTHHVLDDVLWRKDGTSFPVSYYSTPVLRDDVCVGAVVTFEDISLQKKLEGSLDLERTKSIRQAKLASLGEMSAGIAHEINNPLAIITGTVGLLPKFRESPDEFEKKIETIKRSSARIARIVKGLQKFSRSGDKPNYQRHAVTKLINEALILTEPKAWRHGTAISLEGDSSAYILCDEVEIEQVVINMINNAIDAVKTRPEKWAKITLTDEPRAVVIRVTDSGPGIPEDVRNRLFEPFFTTKSVGKGTGLGLSIVKGILDEHKATISVVAEDPNTCFEIRFPKSEEKQNAS